jgi:hypothetical protein
MRVRSLLLTVCLLGLGLAACEATPEAREEEACRVLCGCRFGPLPALQDQCVAGCMHDIDASQISDSCLACVSSNAEHCAQLERQCEPVCNSPDPTDDGQGGGSGL